jgi:tRNA (uracil-5-)-methyltransferase TRM9
MNADTAARLTELNRQFYQTFGSDFSATRQRLQPGVERILQGLKGDERILDLGCGNGQFARRLARGGHGGAYLGLDFSLPLLEQADAHLERFPAQFLQVDLTSPGWEEVISEHIRAEGFDLVTAFAVLHHLPSRKLRLEMLQKVNGLLRGAGSFIHSEWQFLNSPRWQARIQPWSLAGLSERDVEQGDYLLDWRRGGRGLRYVHHFSQGELEELARASNFKIVRAFHSDGEAGKLGLYQIWERI